MIAHIAAQPVEIGPQLRQRCAWCGAVIIDEDLRMIAVQIRPCATCGGNGTVLVRDDSDPPVFSGQKCAHCDGSGQEPWSYPTWEVGALIAVDGGVKYVVDHESGEDVPDECCARLPHELTGAKAPVE